MLKGKRIGFLGAGHMGSALIRGLVQAQVIEPANIRTAERHFERLQNLIEELHIQGCDPETVVKESDVVILAVKPQDMANLLQPLAGEFRADQLVISIAAGLRTQTLEQWFEAEVPVVRVMPNLPVVEREGASAYSLGTYASWPHGVVTDLIFSAVGVSVEVDESQMDAVTALSGSGPAYIFLLAEILTEAGTQEGLPREIAGYLANQTILGGAKLLAESKEEAATLRRQVTSPNGTTAAALAVFEEHGLRDVYYKGIHAARKRSAELSQDQS